jgi:hypothetical protein
VSLVFGRLIISVKWNHRHGVLNFLPTPRMRDEYREICGQVDGKRRPLGRKLGISYYAVAYASQLVYLQFHCKNDPFTVQDIRAFERQFGLRQHAALLAYKPEACSDSHAQAKIDDNFKSKLPWDHELKL